MNRLAALLVLAACVTLAGCSDDATAPSPLAPSFAKGAPTNQTVNFTINDAGMDVVSDGKGTYQDGICGVVGTWSSDILYLAPAGATVPKAQKASCTGIAPRKATMTIALKHVSDNPHVDQAVAPTSYNVDNIKFGFGSATATTVNAGNCGTAGLRFSPSRTLDRMRPFAMTWVVACGTCTRSPGLTTSPTATMGR